MKSPISNTQLQCNIPREDDGELPAILGGEHGVLAGNPEPREELVPPSSSRALHRAGTCLQSSLFALLFMANCLYKTSSRGIWMTFINYIISPN